MKLEMARNRSIYYDFGQSGELDTCRMRVLIVVASRFGNLIVVVPTHGVSSELTRTGTTLALLMIREVTYS